MKKLLVLMMCLGLAFSTVGCGKDNKTDTEKNPQTKTEEKTETQEGASEELAVDEAKSVEIIDGEKNNGEENGIDMTNEEFMSAVDEFNTTEDPERKEELRKQIEEVLNQAEAMAENE